MLNIQGPKRSLLCSPKVKSYKTSYYFRRKAACLGHRVLEPQHCRVCKGSSSALLNKIFWNIWEIAVVIRYVFKSYPVLHKENQIKEAVREAATICSRPVTLTFDLLTLKVVPSHVCRGLPLHVPILVFLGLSVLDLGPMYATDVVRHTSNVRQHHRLMPPPRGGA